MNGPWSSAAKAAFLAPVEGRAALLGLEIGARDAPLLRREEGHVLYADYVDAETLRAESHGGQVRAKHVVEVDIVTGTRRLSEVLGRQVDYIVASHVAEHVPDLLGWFIDLHAVLSPGGTLGLAVPDRRFTFDIFRQESHIAEAVEAHLDGIRRPTTRQIYDSAWHAVPVSYEDVWAGRFDRAAQHEVRHAKLAAALDLVRRVATSGDYNDAHCWVFTPASFLALLECAVRAGLFAFVLQAFAPTSPGGYEFLVVLRKPAEGEPDARLASIASARASLADAPGERAYAALCDGALVELHREMQRLRRERDEARAAIETMQASRLWRVMDPVRRAVDRVRHRRRSRGG